MSPRSRYFRIATYLLAGLLGGLAAWWLGPRMAVAVALGGGIVVGLIGWDRVSAQLISLRKQWDRSRQGSDLVAMEKRLRSASRGDFAQMEALLNLHAMVPVRHQLPATRFRWAAAPDLLLTLVGLIQRHRPSVIIDLGSGASTIWMAMTLREYGIGGTIISIDHDEKYAEITRQRLRAMELEKYAEVRHAPLVDLSFEGQSYPWYDTEIFKDVTVCDLLVVDGPPGRLRRQARYPAMPVLEGRLREGAHVLLDDYGRPAERAVVARWINDFPGWTLEELPLEKGAALLTRQDRHA